jgi:hypothetical protein
MRILGENSSRSWILARDSKDRHYPFKARYNDFEERPRWKDYEVVELHPRGVIVSVKQCYAWFDEEKKSFDVAEPPIFFSNPYDRTYDAKDDRAKREAIELIRDFWERLPKKNQAMFHLNGIIRYENMLVIDDKGDSWKELPHIFVDFVDGQPVSGTLKFLMKGELKILLDDFSLKSFFPKSFPKPKFGKIHDEKGLALPDSICEQIVSFRGNFDTLYDVDGRLEHLKPGDVAVVRFGQKDDRFIQITQQYKLLGSDMLRDDPHLAWQIKQQIEREPRTDDVIDVLEFRSCYEHQWKK